MRILSPGVLGIEIDRKNFIELFQWSVRIFGLPGTEKSLAILGCDVNCITAKSLVKESFAFLVYLIATAT